LKKYRVGGFTIIDTSIFGEKHEPMICSVLWCWYYRL